MKKFTCLLLIALAISYTMAGTCTVNLATTNAFLARLAAIDAAAVVTTQPAAATAICSNSAVLCCDPTKTSAIVSTQINKIKTALTTFGSKASTIGGVWTKIANLVNASAITGTTTPNASLAAAATADLSGATGAQFQAFSYYTPAMFQADFDNFKTQVPTCFSYYSTAIQNIACDGCAETAAVAARWASTTSPSIMLNQASINAWAAACNKVWKFMWNVGWFVQTVAYLNKVKGTTAYTYTGPAVTAIYFQSGTVAIADVNTALTNCGTDATVATCTDANKAVLVKAFVQVYGTDSNGIGRADTTIIAGTTSFASNGRRILAPTTTDGTVTLDATNGLDLTATAVSAAVFPPTAAITLVATDTATWSTGYVAPSSSTSSTSSSSTTTKNAKVVIGTILSAIFAIAFLN
jgi:hypothetical protein